MSITLFCHIFSDNPMPTLHVLCGRAPQTGEVLKQQRLMPSFSPPERSGAR